MGFADVTPEYVDLMTYKKYQSRTSDSTEFEALKEMYTVYLNRDTNFMPSAKYTRGLALLIAHHYALDDTQLPDEGGLDTAVGPVTSERVGDLTQTRGLQPYIGTVPGTKTWLLQSKWGTEFLYLMKTFKPTPIVT
jgi:hypothetical protein